MHFALCLQIVAILCSIAFSVYLGYAGWIACRQLASIDDSIPATAIYLFAGAAALLAFSLWRLARAIRHLKEFRSQYHAHVAATQKA
jgi:TRAP-type C4-dicarboxylate transport system permease small subunit